MPRTTIAALSLTAALAACSTPGSVSGSSFVDRKQAKQDHPMAGQPVAIPAEPAPGTVDLPRFPAMSPDGDTLTFSWRGDLWRVPATGGQAQRLTAHPGNDSTSVWSPDGTQIAFNSDRSGYGNVHVMDADGGNVRQITHEDHFLWLHDWSDAGGADRLTVAGYIEGDVHRAPRPYEVSVDGGPIQRLHDAFGRQSAISPDGNKIVFVRGGARWDRPFIANADNRDLWLYDREDGTFTQLTDNPGNDGRPRWIDNDTIAYLSARPPARVNLYTLDLGQDDDDAVALTSFDTDDVRGFDVARDGSAAVVQVWDTLYTLDLSQDAPEPVAVSITAPADLDDTVLVRQLAGNSDEAALSPDGKVMATTIHGDLYVRTVDSENPPQRITHTPAREMSPVWSPDGVSLYFVSDTDGTLSIYKANVALTREEVEAALTPAEPEEQPEAGTEEENAEDQNAEDAENSNQGEEGSGTPEDNGDTEETPENDESEESEESGDHEEQEVEEDPGPDPADWHGALRFEITPVVQTEHHDADPSPSPDGRTLAFRRGNGDVHLLDLATGEQQRFLESWDTGTHWAWSPDSAYLALSFQDQDHNADIWVGPVDGSAELVNITKHPAGDYLPSWSADGRILAFVSYRNDDQGDIYAVYLDKALETYTPQQLADYYGEATNNAKKIEPLQPVRFSEQGDNDENADEEDAENNGVSRDFEPALDDAYLRLRTLTRGSSSEWNPRLTPSGAQVVYTRGSTAYVIGWDDSSETKVAEGVDFQHLNLAGNAIVALRRGTPATVAIPGGKATDTAFPGSVRVDRHADNRQRFVEASRAISMQFYDPDYKGLDWDAITDKYLQLASRAWTTDEFNDVANQYLGLLDASHMGIRAPAGSNPVRQPNGYLGARYERTQDGFQVTEIYAQTPAAEGVMRLHVGDVITHIDFAPLEAHDTVNARLVGRVGRETAVTVLRSPEHLPEQPAGENPENEGELDPDAPREVVLLLTPISSGQLDDLRYDNWQLNNKMLVDEWSDGQLGYIHIRSMGAASLADFERDLYAACEGKLGMVIDVRDNGGGWTTDRLLASIMTRRHAYTVPRGADPTRTNSYPNDRLFIARYNLPMNALCNEKSFSNAEIFSHAFKTLERGTLVGNTTAGGVISTGSYRLLDGTTVRIPFRGWYLTDGTDMENNGAEPDLLVLQTPEHEEAGEDPQLQAAVEDLMKRVGE